jgi:hypothetical protein
VLPDAEKLVPDARAALADDFNAPVVMAALYEAAGLANRLLDGGKAPDKRSEVAGGGAPDGRAVGAGVPRGIDKAMRRRTLARLGRDIRLVGDALGVFAASPRRKPQRCTGCLLSWNMIDALARFVRARQSQLNSMASCTGIIHDLKRQRDLLAHKRGLHGFKRYRYACEIDQSVRNRNQKYRRQGEKEQVNCRVVLARRRIPHCTQHKQQSGKARSWINERKFSCFHGTGTL